MGVKSAYAKPGRIRVQLIQTKSIITQQPMAKSGFRIIYTLATSFAGIWSTGP